MEDLKQVAQKDFFSIPLQAILITSAVTVSNIYPVLCQLKVSQAV